MTIEEFMGIVSQVRYKPGYTIYAHPRLDLCGGMMELTVVARVPDAGNPACLIDVTLIHLEPLEVVCSFDVKTALLVVGHALRRLEAHEFDEWFRYKDQHVREPHQ